MSERLGADFNRIWNASLITNLADGVLRLAAPLYAITLTQDPVLISLLSALSLLPWLFFAIPIGAIVDRIDRQKALVIGNVVRSIVATISAYLIFVEQMTIWLLLIGIFFIGLCEVLVDTTSQAVLPQILQSNQLERGNSRLNTSEVIVAQFVGTPLSGILYAVTFSLPFFFSGGGFIVAALIIAIFPFHTSLNLPLTIITGATISVWNILLMSCYQSLIPKELFGRIHGARRTIVWGLMPIGSIIGGFIARGGLRLPFLIGGFISIVVVIISFKRVIEIGDESLEANNSSN